MCIITSHDNGFSPERVVAHLFDELNHIKSRVIRVDKRKIGVGKAKNEEGKCVEKRLYGFPDAIGTVAKHEITSLKSRILNTFTR